jgi:hypothetical protein
LSFSLPAAIRGDSWIVWWQISHYGMNGQNEEQNPPIPVRYIIVKVNLGGKTLAQAVSLPGENKLEADMEDCRARINIPILHTYSMFLVQYS